MKRHPSYVPQPTAPWRPARFKIGGPVIYEVAGWELNGLGLDLRTCWRGRHVRKDGTRLVSTTWMTTHLNTGHSVRVFRGEPCELVFRAATDLALLADWTFQGLEGWRNTDPDIQDKLEAWHRRWEFAAEPAGMGRHEETARAIGMERW